MVFWFAYSFDWNGTLGVLVAVLGVFNIGMAYLMSFVYGMMYLLHEMEHLIFWMNYLHHKDSKNCIYKWSELTLLKAVPFAFPVEKSTPA